MTKRTEIEISGLGGQGVITLSKLIASAVILHEDGKNATQTEAYGAAARGGSCWGEVVIHDSEELIDYPRAIPPYDILIVLSEDAVSKYKKSAKNGGIVIYDSTTINPNKMKFKNSNIYDVPAQRIARDKFKTIVSNVLLFGAVIGISGIITEKSGLSTVEEFVPKKFLDLNIHAYNKGIEVGKNLKLLNQIASELTKISENFKNLYKQYKKGKAKLDDISKLAKEEYNKSKDDKFKKFIDIINNIYN